MALTSGNVIIIVVLIVLNVVMIYLYSMYQKDLSDCEGAASPLCPIVYCTGTPDTLCGTLPYRYNSNGDKICQTPPLANAPKLTT